MTWLGKEGEEWVGKGMGFLPSMRVDDGMEACPFCEQDLAGSPLLRHYQAYFSEAYEALKTTITEAGKAFAEEHRGEVLGAFERSVREIGEACTFWGAYIDLPAFDLDTAAIMRDWNAALRALRAKFSAPLEASALDDAARAAINFYDGRRQQVADAAGQLVKRNGDIALVKEQAAGANVPTTEADLARLQLIKVRRDGQGSSVAEWDVHQDCITEHDRNHALVAGFVATGDPAQERHAAMALRPMLEAYLRVAFPADFPPGSLIGPFIGRCIPRVGAANQLLSQADIDELRALKDYGNNFHHDTNPAWQTQAINSQELTGFCQRVLAFARK
ncbi:hypothetical protein I5E68_01455 [Novosphingobium sp. YJ-S2-02]|uniref:DUF4145 domain-containing protein n=1 Tax=Novosphingobium aureum TaxID=2792964 RepID=A0A931H9A6_9SPHN|nr:hypothetical protein [Novosphingobium aureum]MBH0111617.1 hypothetical protein [Novosphingobium aureum]